MRRPLAALAIVTLCSCTTTKYLAEGEHWKQLSGQECHVWNPNPIEDEEVTWDGECVDGKAEGTGTMVWVVEGEEYERYTGEMKAGRQNGVGKQVLVKSGGSYEGELRDGMWQGKGVFTNSKGVKFVGLFDQGRFNGPGEIIYPDGSRTKSEFINWEANGATTLYLESGDVFEKQFVSGKPASLWGTYHFSVGRECMGVQNLPALKRGELDLEGDSVEVLLDTAAAGEDVIVVEIITGIDKGGADNAFIDKMLALQKETMPNVEIKDGSGGSTQAKSHDATLIKISQDGALVWANTFGSSDQFDVGDEVGASQTATWWREGPMALVWCLPTSRSTRL